MNATEFTELLENTNKVAEKNLDDLKKLAWDYPYSQPVQLLYALRLRQSSEHLFNQQLGRTSILSNDRSVLFDLFEMGENIIRAGSSKKQREHSSGDDIVVAEEESIEEVQSTEEQQAEPLKEIKNEGENQQEKKAVKEEESTSKPTKAKEEDKQAEPDLSNLPVNERVKAILEKNRRLRKDFENKNPSPNSEVNERIRAIKEKLDTLSNTAEAAGKEKEVTENERELPGKKQTEKPLFSEDTDENSLWAEEGTGTAIGEELTEEISFEPVTDVSTEEAKEEGSEEDKAPAFVFSIEEEQESKPLETVEVETKRISESELQAEEIEARKEKAATDLSSGDEIVKEEEAEFDSKANHSFNEWLKHLKSADDKTDMASGGEAEKGVESKIELIDAFVEKLPELKKKTSNESGAVSRIDLGKLEENRGSLVTETLARVYLEQKHYSKAIKAYEILKLKYPEKSSFFASQISEIKKLNNSN